MLRHEYFRSLYNKYLQDKCSPEEVDELLEYLRSEGQYKLSEVIARHASNKTYPTDPILGQRLERPSN